MRRQFFSSIIDSKLWSRSTLSLIACIIVQICRTFISDIHFASYKSAHVYIDSEGLTVSYNATIQKDQISKIIDEDVHTFDPIQEEENDTFLPKNHKQTAVITQIGYGWNWRKFENVSKRGIKKYQGLELAAQDLMEIGDRGIAITDSCDEGLHELRCVGGVQECGYFYYSLRDFISFQIFLFLGFFGFIYFLGVVFRFIVLLLFSFFWKA